MTDLEKAARAVCASSLGGFCQNVGGSLGCKNGRGERGHHLCVANDLQLDLAGHTETARAVIEAIREPSEGMLVDAVDYEAMDGRATSGHVWRAMIAALLAEGGTSCGHVFLRDAVICSKCGIGRERAA